MLAADAATCCVE